MPVLCDIQADLGKARLLGDATGEWSAVPQIGDQKPDVEMLRARASQAADWAAGVLGSKRRVSLVCIDTDGSTCLWLRSPNDEQPVLAATLRNVTQDWGDSIAAGSVQRLVESAPLDPSGSGGLLKALRRPVGQKGAATAAPHGSPVLTAPLALVRLFLDDLDARGVRVEAVSSLWHAMAAAWSTGSDREVTAVLVNEPGVRTEWCWGRGGGLIVGGTILDERSGEAAPEESVPSDPAERAAGRLALDWLTWSAHLNVSPSSIVVVGEGSEALHAKIAERWPAIPVRIEPVADPIAVTMNKASAAPAAEADPRRCLVSLTQRPTRARRSQYLWAAAALVCLAGAVAALGYRMMKASAEVRALAVQASAESRALVESLGDPSLLQSPNLVKALESKALMMRSQEPPKGPPAPKPIYEEIKRLGEVLARFEGVRMVQLSIDIRTPITLQLSVPDRRTGEEVRLALAQNPGSLKWTESPGAGTDQVVRLSGVWDK
ncbi:MAG: hypothetical protein JNK58_00330 [Phycisphaerae bacterium]|nr:hypothetical protein [Phycisphaerae bacterium]